MTVGISGSESARVRLDTAIGLTRPLLIKAIAAGSDENITCTCPLARSVNAAGAPLYGTCVQVTLTIERKSSPERCVIVPAPDDATLIWPGLAFASAIRSLTVLTGNDG